MIPSGTIAPITEESKLLDAIVQELDLPEPTWRTGARTRGPSITYGCVVGGIGLSVQKDGYFHMYKNRVVFFEESLANPDLLDKIKTAFYEAYE